MEHRDVIIVGGGPAGSTLARALGGAGLAVTVLDRRTFPRDKTCAGWITPAVVAALDLDLDDYARGRVLQPIHGFRVGLLGGALVAHRHAGAPVSYGIRRCEFDHYLLARCGAEVRTGAAVTSLRREDGAWIVDERLHAPLLVGAGGHFCPVARALGVDLGRAETVVGAQEIEFELSEAQLRDCPVAPDEPRLYFCPDLAGYGWVFRKGRWLNVGLGRERPAGLAAQMDAFRAALVAEGTLPADAPARPSGHAYLLYGSARRPLVAEGALLVGDAAGLAYTQSGEGIRPAVESALLAARTVRAAGGDCSARALAPYAAAIAARFGADRGRGPAAAPGPLRRWLARRLMTTRWFTRRVVTERWFLHLHVPPLAAAGAAS